MSGRVLTELDARYHSDFDILVILIERIHSSYLYSLLIFILSLDILLESKHQKMKESESHTQPSSFEIPKTSLSSIVPKNDYTL